MTASVGDGCSSTAVCLLEFIDLEQLRTELEATGSPESCVHALQIALGGQTESSVCEINDWLDTKQESKVSASALHSTVAFKLELAALHLSADLSLR